MNLCGIKEIELTGALFLYQYQYTNKQADRSINYVLPLSEVFRSKYHSKANTSLIRTSRKKKKEERERGERKKKEKEKKIKGKKIKRRKKKIKKGKIFFKSNVQQ